MKNLTDEEFERIYAEAKRQAQRASKGEPERKEKGSGERWWVLLGVAVVGICVTAALLLLAVPQ